MKPIYFQFVIGLAATFGVGTSAACAQQNTADQATSTGLAAPVPILPADSDTSWLDAPQTPGDWSYRREAARSMAGFGPPGTENLLVLICERGTNQITLLVAGEVASPVLMTVRTETQQRILTASQSKMEMPFLAATFAANDRLLDAMAITKGRFAVEVEGFEPLYIPAWAEVTRVIEDCR